jgi:hypothetical protein
MIQSVGVGMHKARVSLWVLAFASIFPAMVHAQSLATGPRVTGVAEGFLLQDANEPGYNPYLLKREVSLRTPPEREYLVDFRVNVDAGGKVGNIRVTGGMYDDASLGEATTAVQATAFEPATQGGDAVEWRNLDIRILGRGPFLPSITEALREDYTAALQLVTDGSFTEAESAFMDLQKAKAARLFEYALLQDQLATIYMANDRMHEGLVAARHATTASEPIQPPRVVRGNREVPPQFLPTELYVPALRRRFLLTVSLNQIGEAMDVYAQLEMLKEAGQDRATADLAGVYQQMSSALAAETPIGSIVRIVNGKWSFVTSSRHIFGVTGLEGRVDYIDIACEGNARRRMAFTNDSEFALPSSWEHCTLEFIGEDGSQLTLYEYLN